MHTFGKHIVAPSVLGAALTLIILLAGSAAAGPPEGNCPPPFDGPLLIAELPPEIQDFARFWDEVNGSNADGLICIMPVATNNQSGFLEGVNFLDNRVAAG